MKQKKETLNGKLSVNFNHRRPWTLTSEYLKTGAEPCMELIDRGRSLRFLSSLQSSSYFCITSLCCSSPVPHTSSESLFTGHCNKGSNWSTKHFTDSELIPTCLYKEILGFRSSCKMVPNIHVFDNILTNSTDVLHIDKRLASLEHVVEQETYLSRTCCTTRQHTIRFSDNRDFLVHGTASHTLPSLNRRSSDRSPQKSRNSLAYMYMYIFVKSYMYIINQSILYW